jgi:hypothetical protein
LEIVRILLDAGVKFPEHDQAMIHNNCDNPRFVSFATRDHKGDDAIDLEDYSDPWCMQSHAMKLMACATSYNSEKCTSAMACLPLTSHAVSWYTGRPTNLI